jgi:rhodanese-related sulfurtransferase
MLQQLFQRHPPTHPQTGVRAISAADLQQQLNRQEPLVLLDVRSAEEYAHDGRISGSRLLPLAMLPQRSSELPQNSTIVCICRSGRRSEAACEYLARAGFTNVINLTGGIIGWRSAGFPLN